MQWVKPQETLVVTTPSRLVLALGAQRGGSSDKAHKHLFVDALAWVAAPDLALNAGANLNLGYGIQ